MKFVDPLQMWRLLAAQTKEAVPLELAPAAEQAQGAAPSAAPSGNPLTGMLPMFIAFIAIMYFMMIRPQQKREKERRAMLGALAKGDVVVTSGGICGTIVNMSDDNVRLRVDDGVTIDFVRSAVVQVTSRGGEAKKPK